MNIKINRSYFNQNRSLLILMMKNYKKFNKQNKKLDINNNKLRRTQILLKE